MRTTREESTLAHAHTTHAQHTTHRQHSHNTHTTHTTQTCNIIILGQLHSVSCFANGAFCLPRSHLLTQHTHTHNTPNNTQNKQKDQSQEPHTNTTHTTHHSQQRTPSAVQV